MLIESRNLQCANHVIFFSPLLTSTQYDYEASMTQAVGRVRRYGQKKTVHVHHFLAEMTIDVGIFQQRRQRVLVVRDGQPTLVMQDEMLDTDSMALQPPVLTVDNSS